MSMIETLSLVSLGELMRLDMLFWVALVPLLALSILILMAQHRQFLKLKKELVLLKKTKRRAVEYDLVLKAMKLCAWHIDVQARTITYDSDYRDSLDIQTVPPNSDVELFCNTLLPEYKERITKMMIDLLEGRIDQVHEQYLFSSANGDRTNWGEVYAVVDKRDADGKPLSLYH